VFLLGQETPRPDTPLAKGPITRNMAKQIQEELESSQQGEAKLLFTWFIMNLDLVLRVL